MKCSVFDCGSIRGPVRPWKGFSESLAKTSKDISRAACNAIRCCPAYGACAT